MNRLWRALATPEAKLAGLTVVVKVAVALIGIGAVVFTVGYVADPFSIWNRWDAPHYLDIANWGYMAVDPCLSPTYSQRCDLDLFIVFYPLFPWLTRAVNLVVPDTHLAGLTVSAVVGLAVAPLLYRVARPDVGDSAAFRAGWFLLTFPTAFYLHIAYTEALFLALVLGSFLAARAERWWLAGLLGGLAAFTRINGLVLLLALAVEMWLSWRADRRWRAGWLWIGLVPVGFGAYLAVNHVVYGNPFAFADILRDHWYKYPTWPWEGIREALRRAFDFTDPGGAVLYGWTELAFLAIGLIATIASAVLFRASWTAWMAANWLLFTSTSFLLSTPRYTLTMFPVMVGMALLTRRRWALVSLSVVSFGLMAYFAGRFAIGLWAF